MGSDAVYHNRTLKCLKPSWVPVNYNTAYADLFNYSLRFYTDEKVPFVAAHGKNTMMGELRKVFALADALRPTGPKFGELMSKAYFEKPDLVMWVDGDGTELTLLVPPSLKLSNFLIPLLPMDVVAYLPLGFERRRK